MTNIFHKEFLLSLFKTEKKPLQQTAEEFLNTPGERTEGVFSINWPWTKSTIVIDERAIIQASTIRLPVDVSILTLAKAKRDLKWGRAFRWWNRFVANEDRGLQAFGPNCRPCYDKVYHALYQAK